MLRNIVRSIFLRRSVLALGALVLTAGAAKAADPIISGRVFAHSFATRYVWVGPSDNYVVVIGDHSTDLDCWLRDPSGQLVSSDTDPTDVCILRAPGIGSHQLQIRNFGDVYNDYTVYTTDRLP